MGQNVENNTYDKHPSDNARIKCVFNMWKSIGTTYRTRRLTT